MAINQELSRFVRDGLERGASRQEIEEVLHQAGWPAEQVRGALATFADVAFPVPVPRPRPVLSAREAFVYLILFTTLYISAFSLGSLVFQLVNRAFPDPALDPEFAARAGRDAIRWSIAFLIVTFPVFAVVSWRNDQALAADPTRRLSAVRRWLTYLTLFVAAAVLVGDVTTVVYNVLSGEITTRFLLKVLTVGVIAGGVFAYLRTGLRDEEVAS